jgi:peptide-methionine (R)-S-oxide reductase
MRARSKKEIDMIDRRTFAFGGSALVIAACSGASTAQTPTTDLSNERKTNVMTATDSNIDWATLSKGDWQNRLTDEEFYVLRKEGTERPFSSPHDKEKRDGTFVCAGCALPLFKSEMKFDSGTGWPSFYTIIPGAIETKRDFKMVIPRTEYHCSRCGGHQGHVFKDGPRPTGLRYCNNGVALDFIPDAA